MWAGIRTTEQKVIFRHLSMPMAGGLILHGTKSTEVWKQLLKIRTCWFMRDALLRNKILTVLHFWSISDMPSAGWGLMPLSEDSKIFRFIRTGMQKEINITNNS